jgi:hypothetical protein
VVVESAAARVEKGSGALQRERDVEGAVTGTDMEIEYMNSGIYV